MQTMIVIDVSIVTVALPTIQRDLDIDQSHLSWVINAYTIGFGGLLLLAGRLGDLIGRKTVFIAGVAAFTGASALSGLAWSQEVLIATRFFQGVGAGLAYAVAIGVVITLFTEPRERGRALGLVGFAQAAGASAGIILGGAISHAMSWHWVFYVNAGYSPLDAAFSLMPLAIASALTSLTLYPRLATRFASRSLLVNGLTAVTGGLLLATRLPTDPLYAVDILPAITLVGAGSGIVMPAVIATSMTVPDLRDAGLASGVAATSGMVGDTAGIVILTTAAAAHTATLLSGGSQPLPALNDGFHVAFGIAAALAALAAAIASLLLRRHAPLSTPVPR
ncbi:MFS transporter [Microbacterium barkeri]|nr:MFS transporter [Microbacterium barkeri]MDI6942530.1 MFS transporter [Microbacterium barkeri]MDR6875311.1 MFS family permease [Microbacterium barkeri]